jgi:hypothetical protein
MPTKYCHKLPNPKQLQGEVKTHQMWHCKTCGRFFETYHESQVNHICDAPAVSPCEIEKAVKNA